MARTAASSISRPRNRVDRDALAADVVAIGFGNRPHRDHPDLSAAAHHDHPLAVDPSEGRCFRDAGHTRHQAQVVEHRRRTVVGQRELQVDLRQRVAAVNVDVLDVGGMSPALWCGRAACRLSVTGVRIAGEVISRIYIGSEPRARDREPRLPGASRPGFWPYVVDAKWGRPSAKTAHSFGDVGGWRFGLARRRSFGRVVEGPALAGFGTAISSTALWRGGSLEPGAAPQRRDEKSST